MVKISPISRYSYKQQPIKQLKKITNTIPKIATGVVIASLPILFNNCSKIEPPQNQIEEVKELERSFTLILNELGLIKDSNKLEDIKNIGFSDEENNRLYLKLKTLSENFIEAEYLKLNPESLLIDYANLTIEPDNKNIVINIKKNSQQTERQLYQILNRKVVQHTETDGFFTPTSELMRSGYGFIQVFDENNIKRFYNIQNNENIIAYTDATETHMHDFVIN